MRAAYYGGTALTGAGQTLGLLEYAGTDRADLNAYFKNVGQTNKVPITLLSTDGTSTSCVYSRGCDDTEQTLDMTQALGMAPGPREPRGVCRFARHCHPQRHDDTPSIAGNHRLFMGLDAGRSEYARPLLPKNGCPRSEFFCGIGR